MMIFQIVERKINDEFFISGLEKNDDEFFISEKKNGEFLFIFFFIVIHPHWNIND